MRIWIFNLILLAIFIVSLYKLFSNEKYRGGYNPKNGKFGKGPYGNPIYGGFLSSPWYRRGPYYPYNVPYPSYNPYNVPYNPYNPYSSYSYPYFWYPGGYAGCPLKDGCVSNALPY